MFPTQRFNEMFSFAMRNVNTSRSAKHHSRTENCDNGIAIHISNAIIRPITRNIPVAIFNCKFIVIR